MHEQDLAIVKSLVSVAWADGRVASEEQQVIEALLEAFRASPSERLEVRHYARTPRTIDDIPIHDLSFDDRRVLLQHAVLVAYADGSLHDKERALLDQLCERLRVPAIEARGLLAAAEQRAKDSLGLL